MILNVVSICRVHIMRLLLVSLLLMSVIAAVKPASASPANPVQGQDYDLLAVPRSVVPGEVEVIQFFLYPCIHCNLLEPKLKAWLATQGKRVHYRRVHVAFGRPNEPWQRLYYTLEVMGKADQLQERVLHAVHVERRQLSREEPLLEFVQSLGMDKREFLAVYRSPEVTRRMREAMRTEAEYQVGSTPTLVVDGRFVTAPAYFHQVPSLTQKIQYFFAGREKEDGVELSALLQTVTALVERVLKKNSPAD